MPEDHNSNIWLWKDPERRYLNKVINHMKSPTSTDSEIIIMKCEDVKEFDTYISLINYLFSLCLKFELFENERTVFLNLKDLISSIELYLGQQKQDIITDDVSDEDIIAFYNNYMNYFKSENKEHIDDKSALCLKKLLMQSNCIDGWLLFEKCQNFNDEIINHIKNHKYLLLGTPSSFILELLTTLCKEGLYVVSMETPLDASLHGSPNFQTSEKITVSTEYMKIQEISLNTETKLILGSATEDYVEDIILAFLSLLINSRNELALSKAMISPIIDLSHEAFTVLKHLSTEKDMPMCQVAISYVTRIVLGGKGYAPPKDCPMLPHLKGLELFVDILNQMQTIIEDDSKPNSAIKRLINILKKKLLKCGSNLIKDISVETVACNLQSTLVTVSNMMKSRISKLNSQVCQETLDILYHFVNFINSNYFIYDPEIVLEKNHAKRTPLNLPPLLGYFRSPEDESSYDTKSSFNEDSSKSSVVKHPVFPSYFHHTESSDMTVSCVDSSTPSKTTFKGILEDKENSKNESKTESISISENVKDKAMSKKNRKRSILNEITNENVKNQKENNNKTESKKICKTLESTAKENSTVQYNKKQLKKEPKKPKKFKQIQGQGKITNFFIMRQN